MVPMWYHDRIARPTHGREFVRGSYSLTNFALHYNNKIAPIGKLGQITLLNRNHTLCMNEENVVAIEGGPQR